MDRARLILRREDGALLFAKNHESAYFILPGGKVDPGETDEDCAIRECQEELGFIPKLSEKYIYTYLRQWKKERDSWFFVKNSEDFCLERALKASHAFEIESFLWIQEGMDQLGFLPKDIFTIVRKITAE
jgi:8-oxo-dGTP pyrophosphatase MutT (NUDIX family)